MSETLKSDDHTPETDIWAQRDDLRTMSDAEWERVVGYGPNVTKDAFEKMQADIKAGIRRDSFQVVEGGLKEAS